MSGLNDIPQDLDAEAAVLGSCLVAPDVVDDVRTILRRPMMFCHKNHQTIYQAILDIRETDIAIDLLTFSAWLSGRNELESIGGRQYLIVLAESFSDYVNAEYYARIVRETWQRRELMRAGRALLNAARDDRLAEVSELIGKHTAAIEAIETVHDESNDGDLRTLLRGFGNEEAAQRAFIPSGLTSYDNTYGGLECGCLIILAASASKGKTALSGWCALAAARADHPALFVSVEMSARQVANRLLATLSGRPLNVLRHSMTPEDIRVAADCAIRDLAAARLYIRDDLQNVRDIVATARSYARRQGVKLIVVDYLTLCEPGEKHANWNLAVGAMAKAFKRLAKQTGAAVMVLAQLSRDSVKQNRVPQLSDLRDSGEIEQHADIVMFIDHASTPPAKPPATMELLLRVAKYRQDQTREFCLWFNRPLMQFTTGVQNDG